MVYVEGWSMFFWFHEQNCLFNLFSKSTTENGYSGLHNTTKAFESYYKSETWPVQNENTSIQYPVWILNTEVSVSVFNLKNTE